MDVDILVPHILNFGRIIFFEDDDEDGEPQRNIQIKVDNYAERVVPRFTDHQFQRHFRMMPQTFEDLNQKLYSIGDYTIKRGHPEVSLEKQSMVTIWYLGNVESFRSVADRFGISKSSAWDILQRTCSKLLQMNTQYKIICWPSAERATTIIDGFASVNNFPGVIGAIDGCHIPIAKPKDYGNSYINRKGFPSILLQGVCDNRKLFLDVYAGEPGSIHDAKLFQKSDLKSRIQAGEIEFPRDSHLVGDLAYKLEPYLMVGFKNVDGLTDAQILYNFKLSQVRVVIENAFGLLKGRFRRLKMLETVRLDLISLLIVSSCILHNICLLNQDLPDISEQGQCPYENDVEPVGADERDNVLAIHKRNNIVHNL